MFAEHPNALDQSQRIQIEIEPRGSGTCVKIRVEHHDDRLGWYTAASLSFPNHQLPLLEQALQRLRSEVSAEAESDKIIPFPGLLSGGAVAG